METVTVLFIVALILFFGFFAEFIFKKLRIPDVLFLIILGFVLGPHVMGYVRADDLMGAAPIFTTFALLFILYEGAFNIDLASFATGLSKSFMLATVNFLVSVVATLLVMTVLGYDFLIGLLTGVIIGGVSSTFVVPLLKQMNLKSNSYSILTLESAFTDVFVIVFALTLMEIIQAQTASVQSTLVSLTSLFAIAGFVGIVGGIIWIILVIKVFKEHKSHMITIAFLLLLYVITEFLRGNGAIAALFFGLMLRNSKQLTLIFRNVVTRKTDPDAKVETVDQFEGMAVTTKNEQLFYTQISFFLKTFFFVYIGVLIDFSDLKIIAIGTIISFILMGVRFASSVLTKNFEPFDKHLINAVFGRGLAAAAVAQIAIQIGIPYADVMAKIVYVVITGTIILSSIRIYFVRLRKHEEPIT